ncbi:hypothetical protein [Brevibacillus laterosporus]|uniref:Uncharacterized protein n=1 Tax=Brevibacillus laterosporus LMG 15441 TaxID=1042163 RepID=A0A075R2N1_BRELA|nr:hypothetical protein [Brevibacillus laterosporus]AIG26134.1 hypothetical protein BRLA_c018120 [Brevibacillus laterosporus LMG 15441]
MQVKPSDAQLKELEGKSIVRYTSSNVIQHENLIHLTPVSSFESSLLSGFKPVIWFFVGEPNQSQLNQNKISNPEIQIAIPINDLGQNKLLYRKVDNVIGYIGEYIGEAAIAHLGTKIKKKHMGFKSLLKLLWEFAVILFVFSSFLGFNLAMQVLGILGAIIFLIISVSRRPILVNIIDFTLTESIIINILKYF